MNIPDNIIMKSVNEGNKHLNRSNGSISSITDH